MSILKNLKLVSSPSREVTTKNFTQRLIARLVMKQDGIGDYLSPYDHEAMDLLRDCHPQDTGDVDLSHIAMREFYSLNPSHRPS